ncbi:hypothetical protein MKW98_031130, partial [Papaver atlanticum]
VNIVHISKRLMPMFINLRVVVLEIEEVRANKKWMCPLCTENKGIMPYLICN